MSYMSTSDNNKPHLIVTVGIPGSGKSFFAEHFSNTFKAPIISVDKIRQLMFGQPTFSREENTILKGVLENMLKEVLKTERTVIFDGGSDLRSERTAIGKIAKEYGYEPLFVWLQTDPHTSRIRSTKLKNNATKITNDQYENRIKRFTPPHRIEKHIVISGKHTYATQLKIILKHLAKNSTQSREQANNATRPPIKRNFLIR